MLSKRNCKLARDALNLAQLLPNEQMELTYFPIRLKVIIFCLETQWAESMVPIRKRTNLFDVSDKNTTHMIPIVNERTSLFLKFYMPRAALWLCTAHTKNFSLRTHHWYFNLENAAKQFDALRVYQNLRHNYIHPLSTIIRFQ